MRVAWYRSAMAISDHFQAACTSATQRWHAAKQRVETITRQLAEATRELGDAEREIHVLGRAAEVAADAMRQAGPPPGYVPPGYGPPPGYVPPPVYPSSAPTPYGAVTMPVVPGPSAGWPQAPIAPIAPASVQPPPAAPVDQRPADQIVLEEMQRMKNGGM